MTHMHTLAREARAASIPLAASSIRLRDAALCAVAQALLDQTEQILESNRLDMERAQAENLAGPLLKRLRVDEKKIAGMAAGVRALAALEDPIGRTQLARELAPGLEPVSYTHLDVYKRQGLADSVHRGASGLHPAAVPYSGNAQ